MSPPKYRLEHSISDKAGCQQAACKRAGIKIKKGELRLGISNYFEPAEEYRTAWRHWRCVTPFQLNAMAEEWSVTEIPGFKKLSDACKEQVRKSYSAGEVVDKEFIGLPTDPSEKQLNATEEDLKAPEAIAYKVDVATRVAMCRNPSCLESKIKIATGELRLGIIYDDKKSTWMYKHWVCSTRADLEGASRFKDENELEGFEDLSDSHKAVATRSFRNKKPVEPVADVIPALESLAVGEQS